MVNTLGRTSAKGRQNGNPHPPGRHEKPAFGRILSMRRRLFNIVSVVSLVLVVITSVTWVWSVPLNAVMRPVVPRSTEFWADGSVIWLWWFTDGSTPGDYCKIHNPYWQRYGQHKWNFDEYGLFVEKWDTAPPEPPGIAWGIRFPTWWLVSIFSIIPGSRLLGFVIRRQRTASRLKMGYCLQCGYDLRAHQPGQKCPECGTLILSNPASSEPGLVNTPPAAAASSRSDQTR